MFLDGGAREICRGYHLSGVRPHRGRENAQPERETRSINKRPSSGGDFQNHPGGYEERMVDFGATAGDAAGMTPGRHPEGGSAALSNTSLLG